MNTHIQILANQKAPVANRSPADRAAVKYIRCLPHRIVFCNLVFLLIQGVKDDLFTLAFRAHARLGKADLSAAPYLAALGTADGKAKYVPRRAVFQKGFYDFSQRRSPSFALRMLPMILRDIQEIYGTWSTFPEK